MTNETNKTKPKAGRPVNAIAHAAKIEKILAGARACIVRDGFQGTRIAAIAKQVGVSEANIYQYFVSKQDLILAIVDQDLATKKTLFEKMTEAGDILDGFALVLAVMDAPKEVAIMRTELNAAATHDETIALKISHVETQAVATMASMLKAAKSGSGIRPGLDEELAAKLMLSIVDGWYVRLATGTGDFEAMRPIFIDFVRQFLLIDPERPNQSTTEKQK